MITGDTVCFNPKHKNSYNLSNFASYAICSNNEHTVMVEKEDRRYAIFKVSSVFKGNFNYFKDLASKLTQEVGDAFYTYCRSPAILADIASNNGKLINLRNIPITKAKKEAIRASKPGGSSFFSDVFEKGNYPLPEDILISLTHKGVPEPFIYNDNLFDEYNRWKDRTKNNTQWNKISFTKQWGKEYHCNDSCSYPHRMAINGHSQAHGCHIPERLWDIV